MGDLTVWFQYERSEVTNPGYSDRKLKKRKQFHLVGWTSCAIDPHNHLCYERLGLGGDPTVIIANLSDVQERFYYFSSSLKGLILWFRYDLIQDQQQKQKTVYFSTTHGLLFLRNIAPLNALCRNNFVI